MLCDPYIHVCFPWPLLLRIYDAYPALKYRNICIFRTIALKTRGTVTGLAFSIIHYENKS